MNINKTKLSINLSNLERTIFLKCHAYKLAIVRAAEKSAKLHNIFAAKAMLSTLKARYHRLSVQLQVNKSSIQNKQTSTFTVRGVTHSNYCTVMPELGGPGGPLAPPIFGRSVNPIPTGEGRLSPPITKGQLISKCPLGVIVSTKKPTKFF